ncbi:NAD-dependent DNA ligase [Sphingomonas aurantiaca]|jgi:NAD-dependent DNA ligase|uniref:NAD-dependent DNA ligase n=1 Tax=Sphingomonas aurantiaca TaxID=185949 RepID=A0A5E8A5W9_9SPHN|nr:BRCT domain-containing protein [Sphingomonas aurantiaca]VVT26812.1 NAD-dependent DNA ligase [Sphingomonas aurantiaca]
MSIERFNSMVGNDRLSSRQVDELIGIARGVAADGTLNQSEVEFLQKWLAASVDRSDQPIIRVLYDRINAVLSDGIVDEDECQDLLTTLNAFSSRDFELGEVLKATTLPVCDPAPKLDFDGRTYCFTGVFNFGQRKACEAAVSERGGRCGSLTQKTDVLVIGLYATESWKHSSFGNKILKAADMRAQGVPIAIVSEQHWAGHL